jgi:hypothetical protein
MRTEGRHRGCGVLARVTRLATGVIGGLVLVRPAQPTPRAQAATDDIPSSLSQPSPLFPSPEANHAERVLACVRTTWGQATAVISTIAVALSIGLASLAVASALHRVCGTHREIHLEAVDRPFASRCACARHPARSPQWADRSRVNWESSRSGITEGGDVHPPMSDSQHDLCALSG